MKSKKSMSFGESRNKLGGLSKKAEPKTNTQSWRLKRNEDLLAQSNAADAKAAHRAQKKALKKELDAAKRRAQVFPVGKKPFKRANMQRTDKDRIEALQAHNTNLQKKIVALKAQLAAGV